MTTDRMPSPPEAGPSYPAIDGPDAAIPQLDLPESHEPDTQLPPIDTPEVDVPDPAMPGMDLPDPSSRRRSRTRPPDALTRGCAG